jgi:hypothetical protein
VYVHVPLLLYNTDGIFEHHADSNEQGAYIFFYNCHYALELVAFTWYDFTSLATGQHSALAPLIDVALASLYL